MGVLAKFESSEQLTLADLQALAARAKAEIDGDGRTCEVADVCRLARGLTRPCGFVNAGTVQGCPRRKELTGPESHKRGCLVAIEGRDPDGGGQQSG